jgi:hypothetical protein
MRLHDSDFLVNMLVDVGSVFEGLSFSIWRDCNSTYFAMDRYYRRRRGDNLKLRF